MANSNSTSLPPRVKDMTGLTFGRWTVLAYHSRARGSTWWLCRCECGLERVRDGQTLREGKSRSCRGCANRTHGKRNTPEYRVWANMLSRCRDHKHPRYCDWGGRGITVCDQWLSFENFLVDMGERPSPKHSIDRIDNDGNYEPGNCRWATRSEQQRNTRRNA